MIKKLPEWYKVVQINNITVELLEKRSKTINKIVNEHDIEFLLNALKVYLGEKSDQDFLSDLTERFFSEDPLFSQNNNQLELQVLAGAIVAECIKDDYEFNIIIATALKTATFKIDRSSLINTDIIYIAEEFLAEKSIATRKIMSNKAFPVIAMPNSIDFSQVGIQSAVNQVGKEISKYKSAFDSIIDINNHNISVLSEESNIHWWLFKSYSTQLKCQIKELNYSAMPVIIAKELSDLTTIQPGIINADAFFKKIIHDNFNSNTKIKFIDCVNYLPKELREMLAVKSDLISSLLPISFACYLSLQVDNPKDWIGQFEKSMLLKVNKTFESLDLALQAYHEFNLVKVYNELDKD